MPNLEALVMVFVGHEPRIRRLYDDDNGFRAICDDFCAASSAFERWRKAGENDFAKAGDYERLIGELKTEIAMYLATRNAPGQDEPPPLDRK